MVKRIKGLTALLVALAMTTTASAGSVDDIIFFGDSLSDTGNIWYATGGNPTPPYFQGSNGGIPDFTGGQWSGPGGPSWPVLFASTFDRFATPSLVLGGNNYAWGGARTRINIDPTGAPWLDQQVMLYQLTGNPPDEDTLISIMIGGNDVARNLGDPFALQAGIESIITQITNLYGAGARQFLVANVPDIGATPQFQQLDLGQPGIAAFATAWTIQWNTALGAAVEQLQLPGAEINYFDFFTFSKDPELLASFANTTDACFTGASICDDPASYFYWDSFHPSSTSHALLADALGRTVISSLLRQLQASVTGVGPGKSLAKKISSAQSSYASQNLSATCGKLGAFSNQVRAQAGKKLTHAEAGAINSDANSIMNAIGCD